METPQTQKPQAPTPETDVITVAEEVAPLVGDLGEGTDSNAPSDNDCGGEAGPDCDGGDENGSDKEPDQIPTTTTTPPTTMPVTTTTTTTTPPTTITTTPPPTTTTTPYETPEPTATEAKPPMEFEGPGMDEVDPHGMVRPNSTIEESIAKTRVATAAERERQAGFFDAVDEPDRAAETRSEHAFDQAESLQRIPGAPAEQQLGGDVLRVIEN